MLEAADLGGALRIFNGAVDMGAYEFTMTTEANVLLQGAYVTASNTMVASLRDSESIPLVSPYAADVQEVSAIPEDTTDWVLLQLLNTNDYDVVASKSAFLRSDSQVTDEEGASAIRLECSPGYYHLLAKHRNHCAVMSALPIAYTSKRISYDFSTNWMSCFGGTNACVELKPGAWGLIAGDADGDGRITEVDRSIVSNQTGKTGYLCGDANLDGVVDDSD